MQLANIVGRGLVVNYSLLDNLQVDVKTRNGQTALYVSGRIMESVKVYQGLKVTVDGFKISLTVLSCLVFWQRSGSPDFEDNYELNLSPGTYRLEYVDQTPKAQLLKTIQV